LGYNVFQLRKGLVDLMEVTEEQKLSKLEIGRLTRKAESHRMEKSTLEIEYDFGPAATGSERACCYGGTAERGGKYKKIWCFHV
jgi:hypothetical protein